MPSDFRQWTQEDFDRYHSDMVATLQAGEDRAVQLDKVLAAGLDYMTDLGQRAQEDHDVRGRLEVQLARMQDELEELRKTHTTCNISPTMTPIYNLKHRQTLLGGLVDVVNSAMRRTEERRGHADFERRGDGRTPLEHLNVILRDQQGEAVLETDFQTALDYVVNDTYWNENGDWSQAYSVEEDQSR